MLSKTFFKIEWALLCALLLSVVPSEKAYAWDAAACKTAARTCAEAAVGTALACAADAVVDGLTTAGCLLEWAAVVDCAEAVQDCSQNVQAAPPAVKASGPLLGNDYADSTSQTIICPLHIRNGASSGSMVESVSWRATAQGIVSITLYCTNGVNRIWNGNIVGTETDVFSCDTGELVHNMRGKVRATDGLLRSLGFICDHVSRGQHAYSAVLGEPLQTGEVLVNAGCASGSYLAGMQIFYDPTKSGANQRYRVAQGIQAICR